MTMTNFTMMRLIVEHAQAWNIDDPMERIEFGPVPRVVLPANDIALLIAWTRNLMYPSVHGSDAGFGHLTVDGQIMSGHHIQITMQVPASRLEAARLLGTPAVGELYRLTRTEVATHA